MVTWENYEEYLILHADGELRPDEAAELLAFAQKHPEVKKEMNAYQLVRITPDNEQVFAHKDLLLKPLPNKRIIAFPTWVKYGIAAGLVALFFIYRLTPTRLGGASPQAANIQTVPSGNGGTCAGAFPLVVNPDKPKQALPMVAEKPHPQNSMAFPHTETQSPPTGNGGTRAGASKQIAEKPPIPNSALPAVAEVSGDAMPINEVGMLPVAGARQMPCVNDELPIPGTTDMPDCAVDVKHTSRSRMGKLWEKVPLARRNKEQIEKVAGFVASAYGEVAHAKQNLDDKSLSLKIENDQLVLSIIANN